MKQQLATEECVCNTSENESFEQVMKRRIERRDFLKGAAVTGALLIVSPELTTRAAAAAPPPLTFTPIQANTADTVTVPLGYAAQTVIRWGDPLFPGAPSFNIENQTAAAQRLQFGYNNDFVGFFEFPRSPLTSRPIATKRGLLAVNHEYTDAVMMFPIYAAGQPTKEQVDIELAAHGVSIVEVEYKRIGLFGRSAWQYNYSSYNRRITAETEMLLTGPAAGSERLKTAADPTGTRVRGTLNNCGGGKTPWGTLLSAEENFNQYFANNGKLPNDDPRKAIHTRYGLPTAASERRWENFYDRFDLAKEPNEPFRFGWVVEIDPFNPNAMPKKRTALGRMKHEAATVVIAPSGQVVTTRATMSASTRRTSLFPKISTTPPRARPISTCSIAARSTLPNTTTTARASGFRSQLARARWPTGHRSTS